MNVQLPVVRATECERTFTYRKSSRMWKNFYLSQELPNVNEQLPVPRAPECNTIITLPKGSQMWKNDYLS